MSQDNKNSSKKGDDAEKVSTPTRRGPLVSFTGMTPKKLAEMDRRLKVLKKCLAELDDRTFLDNIRGKRFRARAV